MCHGPCGCRMCMLGTCVIMGVMLIGLLFGSGVFKDGFHKLRDALHGNGHASINCSSSARPFLGFPPAPSPF